MLCMQGIAAESRAKLARLREAWKEKAVMDKAVASGDVSKIKKKKVRPCSVSISGLSRGSLCHARNGNPPRATRQHRRKCLLPSMQWAQEATLSQQA